MNRILINEPVWNGGRPYVSIKKSKITDTHVFVECDYKDKNGSRTFPHIYYMNGDEIRQKKVHTERWGKAYHLEFGEMETVRFWFTIGWDGEEEGEYTTNRPTYDLMVEGIKDYLIKWRERDAYLVSCAMETSKKTHSNNLTDLVKQKINEEI